MFSWCIAAIVMTNCCTNQQYNTHIAMIMAVDWVVSSGKREMFKGSDTHLLCARYWLGSMFNGDTNKIS
jgi:hypothetical protein